MLEENEIVSGSDNVNHPMNFLLAEDFQLDFPQAGEIRQGQVVANRGSDLLIDIGAKSEGVISGSELESLDTEDKEELAIGNWISVYVVNPEDQDGNTILSYTKAMEVEDWNLAEELLESQETYQGRVVGYNKGGVLVKLGRIRGFIPASLLGVQRRSGKGNATSDDRLGKLVGEKIMARVIEVDRSRNRLILSERAAMKEIRAAQRSKLLDQLEEGQVREGTVVNLADFGAFIDIGGLEGLAHLSELGWKRINHPSDMLKVGDRVNVYILGVDHDRNRVALSLKRLEPDPWTVVNEHYQEGSLVEVTITKLTKYGAFACLNDDYGLEGLIHISELAEERVDKPQDIVSKDDVVTARIIRIDSEQRQMGLSLKQVMSPVYLEQDLAMARDAD